MRDGEPDPDPDPEDLLDAINNAEDEAGLKTALEAADIENIFDDVEYKSNIDGGNPATLEAVQGLVDKTNATLAMPTATFENNILTVTVKEGITPVKLEVDNSLDKYEFEVEAKSITGEELVALLNIEELPGVDFISASVNFNSETNTWTINFGTDPTIAGLLENIKFYLSVTANDGKVYGSMYNGGYLTSN